MPKITFISDDGDEHVVDADNGASLMNAAVDNLVTGIDADCGGECSCATCHVYVKEEWMQVVGNPGDREEEPADGGRPLRGVRAQTSTLPRSAVGRRSQRIAASSGRPP